MVEMCRPIPAEEFAFFQKRKIRELSPGSEPKCTRRMSNVEKKFHSNPKM